MKEGGTLARLFSILFVHSRRSGPPRLYSADDSRFASCDRYLTLRRGISDPTGEGQVAPASESLF